MDLVSAARRLSRPFVFASPDAVASLPIADHGLIGNGFTAGLVGVDGSLAWLCMPRFDSPSVFAKILDPRVGGSMAIRPTAFPFESVQAYDPDTNVLETLFLSERGRIRLVDSMPWSDDPRASIHEVHRRVDCPNGEVEVEILFDPRFDFGRDVPQIELGDTGVLAIGRNGERLALSVAQRLDWQRLPTGGARATVTLRAGSQFWCVLSWGDGIDHVATYRPWEHLRLTRRRWREWSSKLTYDGPLRHHVLRSALALKLLIYAPTGAVVAAPTTSLPEWIGGGRNWDYRFCWPRDSAMAIRAANLIGFGSEARDFYHFLRDSVAEDGMQLMYTIDGRLVPQEETLTHLAGHRGSSPVRFGNGARDQLQLDVMGAVIDGAHLFERFGGTLTLHAWRKVAQIVEQAHARWHEPDHGIWEPRSGVRHNVHSKLMCWLALDRGAHLALAFGRKDLQRRWTARAEEITADICALGMDARGEHFVSVYGENRPDAALLLLPVHGFLDDLDPRLVSTVRWVQSELSHGPFLYRYRGDDGVAGPEGAFILCGFWLAEALALQGNLDEAQAVLAAHAESSNHLGLLAEEIDPRDRSLLGNFPQAFSHLGLINAVLRVDLALRLRDEGSARAPHLIGSSAKRPPASQRT